jgi:hypothetical protein
MQEEQIRTALAVSTREYQSDQPSRKLPRPRLAVPPRGRKKRRKQLLAADRSFHIRTLHKPDKFSGINKIGLDKFVAPVTRRRHGQANLELADREDVRQRQASTGELRQDGCVYVCDVKTLRFTSQVQGSGPANRGFPSSKG